MIAYDRLKYIIPADQALANKALGVALQQFAGINDTQLPLLAQSISQLETTKDLPLITALTQPVPDSVVNYFINTLTNGTNTNVRVVDVVGLAAGWQATELYAEAVEILSTMNLSYLTLIYQTMANSLNGIYGDTSAGPLTIPAGLPAAGTYTGTDVSVPPDPPSYNPTSISLAMTALKSAAITEINNLIALYPTQTTQLNNISNQLSQQIITERQLQTLVNLDYSTLTSNDRNSIYGFIYSLPNYGLDTAEGGMSWFLETMANLTVLPGEAIVASLREGRNEFALGISGLTSFNRVPSAPNPPPPEATLIPSTYSENEAKNLVIK